MKNVHMVIKGKKLLIEVDLSQNCGESKSGKSLIIATSGGNQPIPANEDIKIGLNVYKTIQKK